MSFYTEFKKNAKFLDDLVPKLERTFRGTSENDLMDLNGFSKA